MDKLKFLVKWTIRIVVGLLWVAAIGIVIVTLPLLAYYEPWKSLIMWGAILGVMLVVFALGSLYEWATDK